MFLLSFDIPREFNALRLRVFKKLKKIKARMVHESLWESDNLKELINLAILISKKGGQVKY